MVTSDAYTELGLVQATTSCAHGAGTGRVIPNLWSGNTKATATCERSAAGTPSEPTGDPPTAAHFASDRMNGHSSVSAGERPNVG